MAPVDEVSRPTGELPYDVLDGRYRLESLVGRGGMAAVYRATDTRLDRPVAIKMLADGPAGDDRRFQAEVRTLAGFSHPNLVRLLDAGEVDGRLYLVMDFITGTTLAARVRGGRLPEAEVARIGADVAAALAYVHAEGIVHRDIKPANILLDARGVAYLADFGIARLVDTTRMTATGLVLGTPAYLAPEQLEGGDVDAAADVFALGLVLIECLSGERAFTGTLSEVAASRAIRSPEIPAGLGDRWTALLRSMTARDPRSRVTAASAAIRLSSWSEPPPTLASTKVAPVGLVSRGATSGSAGGPTKTRVVAAAALVAALVVGLVLGVALFGSSPAARSSGARRPRATAATRSTRTRASTPSTTTTTVPTPTVPTAAGDLVTALAAGAASGNVTTQAGQQLLGLLQPLLFSSGAGASTTGQDQQFDQLAQAFDHDVANGQINGSSTVSSLTGSIGALAAALGTTVPAPATTTPATPGKTPTPPGDQGKGNGNGNGKGNS